MRQRMMAQWMVVACFKQLPAIHLKNHQKTVTVSHCPSSAWNVVPPQIYARQQAYPTDVRNKLINYHIIQPLGQFWQEPEPSRVTGMALARCILSKFLGVVCHCFPLKKQIMCIYYNRTINLWLQFEIWLIFKSGAEFVLFPNALYLVMKPDV
jgi:hypothetical protein